MTSYFKLGEDEYLKVTVVDGEPLVRYLGLTEHIEIDLPAVPAQDVEK